MTHTQVRRAPRVATIHNVTKEKIRAHLTLVHVFHVYASVDTPWVAHALSRCTSVRYGKIASISTTHNATQFGDFICPVCVSIFQMLVQQGSTDAGLNRHRQGLPPWSSEFQIKPLPFLPIYDIPPLSKDGQSQPRSLRGVITEVITHNTSHTKINPKKCSES
jgi:hypothetical protein